MRFLSFAAGSLALGLAGVALMGGADSGSFEGDTLLRAMSDELQRSKAIKLNDLGSPYFIQYAADDAVQLSVGASLGGLTHSNFAHARRPSLALRVGDYAFDNTNSIYSSRTAFGLLPLDNDYLAIRTALWRATDVLYKTATAQITAKRTALREISDPDKTPDLAAATPLRRIDATPKPELDEQYWDALMRKTSVRFASHPDVLTSSVQMQAIASTYRLVNSEGTVLRLPQNLNEIQIRTSSKAPDGQRVWNSQFLTADTLKQFPDENQLSEMAEHLAAETEAIAKAPLAEDYAGPVIFEREAAAQMMAQVMTDTVTLHRKPIAPPGGNSRGTQMLDSVWSARIGSKVMPEWFSVVDDPLQTSFRDTPLAGHYLVDDEGVPAQRVELVDKGVFKNFLLSRLPIRKFNGSNGHGRLPGPFGSEDAELGNLLVEASQSVSDAYLKAQLITKIKTAGLKFGLLIRRLDFPSTATMSELQSMAQQLQQSGSARTLNQPLLAYRVYPDGKEELVRGLRFRDFSAKDLRDIAAAGNSPYVLNYVSDGSGLNLADLRREIITSSVICPSLLFDSIELAREENDVATAPLVPAPTLIPTH
jgi:TldD protein